MFGPGRLPGFGVDGDTQKFGPGKSPGLGSVDGDMNLLGTSHQSLNTDAGRHRFQEEPMSERCTKQEETPLMELSQNCVLFFVLFCVLVLSPWLFMIAP